ncbi:VWA domain-containing protein [Leekyejoonella antrihumi]|uniref:VWA domain-containing protein n=2 Tax=Leekyejoonella antrihumi TaxID=1660198 RepID=A0A563DUU1_9MICO|nr:VWA domain-containing protein [Leekyejoonella antrihumi]
MFDDVDQAAFVAAFGERLRHAGVPVSQNALIALSRAMHTYPYDSRQALYWSARVTLVSRRRELPAFDEVFAAVFERASIGLDPPARRHFEQTPPVGDDALIGVHATPSGGSDGAGLPWQTLPATFPRTDAEDSTAVLRERLPSELRSLVDTPFGDLDPADLALLDRWLEQALRRWPTRRTRRRKPCSHGTVIDLRRTMTRARRTGGDPADLVRTRRTNRPRPVVMLCDVSQSMQPYSTAYLHLMRALANNGNAETFAFSTSLTRLTPALQRRSATEAIEEATEHVVDRFGGTRIATNIRAVLSSRHGTSIRGAIVVVASDGWDSDPATDLASAMSRLHRRAHRVIWLNPRAGSAGFLPLVASMSAALPYCDEFLPAHTVRALADALELIGQD